LADEYDGQDNHDPIDHAIAQFHAEEGFRLLAVTTAAPADSVIVHIVVVKAHSYCPLLGLESVYLSADLLRGLSASAVRPSIYLNLFRFSQAGFQKSCRKSNVRYF